jgi:hypothetical protein
MKGIIICLNNDSVCFSLPFKREWLYRQDKDIPKPFNRGTLLIDPMDELYIDPTDELAIELFEEMGADWSGEDDYNLELYEFPDIIFDYVVLDDGSVFGQRLYIDWDSANSAINAMEDSPEKTKFINTLKRNDKFLMKEFD